jgi:hypothetical protein
MEYLVIFVVLFMIGVVGVFLTLSIRGVLLGVPYVPTPKAIREAMLNLAELQSGDMVYDLGAGDGRLLIAAKRRCLGIRARGYELVTPVWLLGKLLLWWTKTDAGWHREDAFRAPLNDADVVFLYLMPNLMRKLEPVLDRELRPGTRVVSHAFPFPKRRPLCMERCTGLYGSTRVFLYRW